jgi:ABC-type tungstate transport system permease subunit
MKRSLSAALLAALLLVLAAPLAHADNIRIQSTTDTKDAGLVTGYNGSPSLQALFTQWETANGLPQDTFTYTPVGTSAALANARAGQADVAITHAPTVEAQFVRDGYSNEPVGRAIFYSDYVILGPLNDPAGIQAAAPHDAITAFEKIAQAGDAGNAVFDSRAEASGTNVQEQIMWARTDPAIVPTQVASSASNPSGDPTRHEPGTGGTVPSWYVRTNKGQADNVKQCAATPNCYTMTDRGTFNNLVNTGVVANMKVVSDKNTPDARGGQNLLVNPFTAYVLNPSASYPNGSPTPDVAAATRFVDFLTSQFFQDYVATFPSTADPAFRPDAFPQAVATVQPSIAAGQVARLDVTMDDRLPGGGPVNGLFVQLQGSTDGGRTYTNIGVPQATNLAGGTTFYPRVDTTTTYRVTTTRTGKFSPSASTLGVIAAVATGGPVVTVAKDTTPPKLSNVKFAARSLSLVSSEAATIKATIKVRKTRKAGGRTRTTYVTVKALTLYAAKAGTRASHAFTALKAGTYQITLAATDRAGNRKTTKVAGILKATTKAKAKK